MSDVSDGSGPVPRRTPRTADGGAPVSGALAIVLAVVAVVAGFFILRSISGDDKKQFDLQSAGTGAATDGGGDTASTTTPISVAVTTTLPTTTTLVVAGATVIVANANGIGGTAATMSDALAIGPGFTMGEPTDASSATDNLDTTVIYYDPAQAAAQAVAESVNLALGGGTTVLPLQGTPPVASGDIGGAGVLVMLGLDKANKTLEELNPTTGGTAPVGVVTNPPLTSEASG
jgi:hypothetical protein